MREQPNYYFCLMSLGRANRPLLFFVELFYFLKGYSNCPLRRKCLRNLITQKKPAIQRVLNTPSGQILCFAGFLNMNNKRIDRSIVSMLRSIIGGEEGTRTLAPGKPRPNGLANRPLHQLGYFSMVICAARWFMAEREGFEPPAPCGITGFQDQLHKPLGHLSGNAAMVLYQKPRPYAIALWRGL